MGAFHVSCSPLLVPTPPPPPQARQRAALNELERLEDLAAKNKPASPVPIVVVSFFSILLPDAEQFKHSPVQISEHTSLDMLSKQLQEAQARVAALTRIIASRNESAVAQPSLAVVTEEPGPSVAHSITDVETAPATAATSDDQGDDPTCESARQKRRFSI